MSASALAIVCGCGHVSATQIDATQLDAPSVDGAKPACDVTKPFGAPVLVDGVNTSADDLASPLRPAWLRRRRYVPRGSLVRVVRRFLASDRRRRS